MQRDDEVSIRGTDRVMYELTVCPSFSTYYSDRQSAAARAVNDVLAASTSTNQPRSELDEDDFGFATGRFEKSDEVDEDVDEFEFSILCNENEIGQIFPIFDRDLIGEAAKVDAASVSLKKMFLEEERDDRDSESEAEGDQLESVEPGTYCVWRPKTPPSPSPSPSPSLSPSRCKKSKSTGSCSKRWNLRDLLLRRSNSDGKDSFVYLTPSITTSSSSSSNLKLEDVKSSRKASNTTSSNLNSEDGKSLKSSRKASAHEMFYVVKRAVKEEDKRRSYLPYRKGLVGFGFFPNVGMGVTNNFRPF